MTAGYDSYKESDGKSIDVTLSYNSTPGNNTVAYVEGWLGLNVRSGDSGDTVALNIEDAEYQFEVPASLSVSKGDIVRIDTTQVTGTHVPPDAAYNKNAASATNLSLFKATAAKDSNNVVTGILLVRNGQ